MQAFGSEDFGLAWFGEVPGLAVQGATRFESRELGLLAQAVLRSAAEVQKWIPSFTAGNSSGA